MRRSIKLAGVVILGAAFAVAGGPTAYAGEQTAYIVVLADSVADPAGVAATHARQVGGTVGHVYQHALKGYSITMPSGAFGTLGTKANVVSVETDKVATIQAQTVPTGVKRIFADQNPNLDIDGQDDVRIDVDVAVLDTGVEAHPDLNVVARTDCANKTSCTDNAGNDGHGHGTHVGGSVGAIDNDQGVVGVAPGARLTSVKVLADNGSGNFSGIVAGIDWVAARASTIEVVNMSLGCDGCSDNAASTAIRNAVDKGVVFVVAAGNSNKDASGFFPANHPDVVTVSALADSDGKPGGTGGAPSCRTQSSDDTLADYSNWGTTVEVTAPGTCIYSTYKGGGYSTLSGTSMASPHVAGAAGVLASGGNKPTNRDGVLAIRQKLMDTGNSNWTDRANDGEKEPLLDVHDSAQYPPGSGGNKPPVAKFTETCDKATLACTFDGSTASDPDGTVAKWDWDFGDGSTGSGKTASHTYAKAGKYTVRLTVTDDKGATGSTSHEVQVGDPPPNQPPTAAFTQTCYAFVHGCVFDGRGSKDPDGTIASWAWDFGDGTKGTGDQVWHPYGKAGTFTVTLTVTDDKGATATTKKTVTVP